MTDPVERNQRRRSYEMFDPFEDSDFDLKPTQGDRVLLCAIFILGIAVWGFAIFGAFTLFAGHCGA